MSTTNISPIYDLGTRADYLEMGRGSKASGHRSAGTNRIAPGFHVDAANIDEFIELGNRLAAGNKRRVKAQGLLVNFHPDELDVRNPDDLQRGGDLALELARRAFPNSPTMVVVHDDADGGHVHAHVVILNHDVVSGLAPKKNRTHAQISKLNDELMREEGMRVVEDEYMAAREKWASRRADLPAFEQSVGDRVAEAKAAALKGDLDAFNEVFKAECKTRGVDMDRTEHLVETDTRRGRKKGDVEVGITYRALDDSDPRKPRRRRKAASKLSREFTDAGLQQAVEIERQRRVKEAERQRRSAEVQRVAREQSDARVAAIKAQLDESVARAQERLAPKPPEAPLAPLPAAPPALAPPPPDEQTELPVDAVETDTGPVAPLPADPSSLAPLPPTDETVDETEVPALATAPAGRTVESGYRSLIELLPVTRPRDQPYHDRMSALDRHVVDQLRAGQPLDAAFFRDVGQSDIDRFEDSWHALTLDQLNKREAKKARAKKWVESGDEILMQRGWMLRDQMGKGDFEMRRPKEVRRGPTAAQHAQRAIEDLERQQVRERAWRARHDHELGG